MHRLYLETATWMKARNLLSNKESNSSSLFRSSFELPSAMFYEPIQLLYCPAVKRTLVPVLYCERRLVEIVWRDMSKFLQQFSSRVNCLRLFRTFPVMVSEIIYMKYHNLVIHLVVFFVILNKLQHSCHYGHNKSEEILLINSLLVCCVKFSHPPGLGSNGSNKSWRIFRGSVNGIL